VIAAGLWIGVASALLVNVPIELVGSAAAQGVSSSGPASLPSSLDQIRRAEEEARQRRQQFDAQVLALDNMIESMKQLAFEVDLRLARIRAGDYERSCDGAEREMQAVIDAFTSAEQARADTERLCSNVRASDSAAASICANRRADLESRSARLLDARRALEMACPEVRRRPK
jgi:hypothetical protein